MPADYPTVNDVQSLLQGAGYLSDPMTPAQSVLPYGIYLQLAIDKWEQKVQFTPFKGATQTRLYDPPGASDGAGYSGPYGFGYGPKGGSRKLMLDCPLSSITSLRIGIATGDAGTELTLGSDYYLKPDSAINAGKPATYIEFVVPQYDITQSISITGVFGYDPIPDDAYLAALYLAALEAAPSLARLSATGRGDDSLRVVTEERFGDEARKYGGGATTNTGRNVGIGREYGDPVLDGWAVTVKQISNNYRLFTFA